MGKVGTGKTTLCRQLIQKLAPSPEDALPVETHLIMDPSFTSAFEFLSFIAMNFGIGDPRAGESEWQIKENIKHYLFRRGIDEDRIVVLIIDEGQKLPGFCLELLREFLNYETNEYKLLQIVIFAQEEFKEQLGQKANFTDRINEYCYLRHLNYRETRQMIRYRLTRAAVDGSPPALFSYLGLWAVYRATTGYPRKIITLCHNIMLALIIQNRSKAGYFLVRACAKRLSVDRRVVTWSRVTAGVLFAILLLLFMSFFGKLGISVFQPFQKNFLPAYEILKKELPSDPETNESVGDILKEDVTGPVAVTDQSAGIKMQDQSGFPLAIKKGTPPAEKKQKKETVSPIIKTDKPLETETEIKMVGGIDPKLYYPQEMIHENAADAYHRTAFSAEKAAVEAGYREAPKQQITD
jgi:general secretion pathway protein A